MIRIKVQKIGNMHSVAVTPTTTVADCMKSLLERLIPSAPSTHVTNATSGTTTGEAVAVAPALLEQIKKEYSGHWLYVVDESGERLLYPYEPAVRICRSRTCEH